ncbi:MAG: hypothetical protein AB7P14_11525 [Blastocatellales bacterium]
MLMQAGFQLAAMNTQREKMQLQESTKGTKAALKLLVPFAFSVVN